MTTAIDYVKVLRRNWVLIVALVVVGALGGYLFARSKPNEYTAHTQLFVSAQAGATASDLLQGSAFSQQRVKSYADIVNSAAVLGPVAEQLGISGGASAISGNVSASVQTDTVIVEVSAVSRSPQMAARLANAVSAQFTKVVGDLELPGAGGEPAVRITSVQSAQPPSAPSAPNRKFYVVVGAVVGLLLAWMIAIVRTVLDTKLRSADELRGMTDVPILGVLPRIRDREGLAQVSALQPASPVSEAYRQIRTNLRYVNVDAPLHRILVTSAMPAEGKSTTVTNLALSIAETGATVVIVDADLRRPAVRRYLHLGQFRGLSTVLSGECTADQAIETYGDTSLQILAAGPIPPNPSELLSSDAMSRLLDELGRRYEYVIVDSPPTLPVSDAAILSGQVDGTLLICRQGTVKRRDVERVIAQLQQIGANLAGIILNDVRTRRGDDYSYYGTGYASHENVGTPGDADPVVAADDRNAPV